MIWQKRAKFNRQMKKRLAHFATCPRPVSLTKECWNSLALTTDTVACTVYDLTRGALSACSHLPAGSVGRKRTGVSAWPEPTRTSPLRDCLSALRHKNRDRQNSCFESLHSAICQFGVQEAWSVGWGGGGVAIACICRKTVVHAESNLVLREPPGCSGGTNKNIWMTASGFSENPFHIRMVLMCVCLCVFVCTCMYRCVSVRVRMCALMIV